MSEQKYSALVTIRNPQGLHMRPAYLFAETAAKFQSKVELVRNDARIDGKSVLSILTLGAAQGTELLLETIGPDAEGALHALVELVTAGFPGEEPATQAGSGG